MLVHELMKALNSVKSIHYVRNSKKLTVQEMRTCHLLPQMGHSPVPNWRPFWSRLPLCAAGPREAEVLRTCRRGGRRVSGGAGTGSKESALRWSQHANGGCGVQSATGERERGEKSAVCQ